MLLDTQTFAWAVGDPSLLGERAHALLLDPDNELLVSPASVWEMSIKHRAGRWPEVAPFMDEQLYPTARNFYVGAGVVVFVVWLFTDYARDV